MEEEILNELKVLTEILSKDVELRSKELNLQVEKTSNEKELAEIADQEAKQQKAQDDLKKAKDEQRALQIEQYIKSLQENEDSTLTQVVDAINLNSEASLEELGSQLSVISEKLDQTEQVENVNNATYFSSMTIIIFLCFAIPAVATYKFLSRLFDSFIA